jgi:hypothetical protein
MEKKAISGGGGGSDGAAVSFMDDLVAEAKARTPPDGAFTIAEFMEMPGVTMGRFSAAAFLDEKVAAGRLASGKFPAAGGAAWYYWPVNPKAKPPAKKARR